MAGRRLTAERRRRIFRALRWYALAGVILLEIGLRFVFGNFAQARMLQQSKLPDVCLENRPDIDLEYTGWLLKVPPTRMRTNSLGGRGEAPLPHKAPGTLRVVQLGDSFTFGQGVQEDEPFVKVLERELGAHGVPVETLNFGVPGHGTPQSIALLEHKLLPLEPDVVLINVFANDLSAEDSYCMRGPRRGRKKIERWLLLNVYLARVVSIIASPLRRTPQPDDIATLGSPEERYIAALQRGQALADEHGFLFGVVLLTDPLSFIESPYCKDCTAPHQLNRQLAVRTFDMSETWRTLQADSAPNYIAGEGHFTVQGNRLMGEALAQEVLAWPELAQRAGGTVGGAATPQGTPPEDGAP